MPIARSTSVCQVCGQHDDTERRLVGERLVNVCGCCTAIGLNTTADM